MENIIVNVVAGLLQNYLQQVTKKQKTIRDMWKHQQDTHLYIYILYWKTETGPNQNITPCCSVTVGIVSYSQLHKQQQRT